MNAREPRASDATLAALPEVRLVVGIIVPGQHLMDRAGAATVFQQQFDLVKRLGLRSQLIIVAPARASRRAPRAARLAAFEQAAQRMGADDVVVLSTIAPLRRMWRSGLRLAVARALQRWDLRSDLAASDILDVRQLPANGVPDAVICNYLSGLSVANALVPRQRQILVLHDCPESTLSPRMVHELDQIPHRVTLSAKDADCLAACTPTLSSHIGIPWSRQSPLTCDAVLSYRSFADVLDACRPERSPQGGWSASDGPSAGRLDLLFVGGSHQPNLDGLASFVKRCFLPFLQRHGIRLIVAGAVGPALWQPGQEPTGIIVLGRVGDLRPLYVAAKLVVVPLLSGTGLSLKTVEAISFGKPVLSSPVGLRGLPHADGLALAPPFDERWAQRIRHLLDSRRARRQLRDDLMMLQGRSDLESTLVGLLRVVLDSAWSMTQPIGSPVRETRDVSLTEWPGPISLDTQLRWHSHDEGCTPSSECSERGAQIKHLADLLRAGAFGTWADCQDMACDIVRDLQRGPPVADKEPAQG